MKVITIWQPWASLIVLGHKKIETRGWATKYRGPLLIHAAAKWDKQLEYYSHEFHQMTKDIRVYHNTRGAIIGKVDLHRVEKSEELFYLFQNYHSPLTDVMESGVKDWKKERVMGDYSPGRYGWILSDPVAFGDPIPVKGQQGLWNYDLPENYLL